MRLRLPKDKTKLIAVLLGCLAFLQLSSLLGDAVSYSTDLAYQRYLRELRELSINLGGGDCKWTAPKSIDDKVSLENSTLLASYPGSGKRLTWLLIEALTGNVVGDDWDLSLHGNHVVALKTVYPHDQGVWTWGDKMAKVILQVRNPRFAIQSYLNVRDELDYSESWWPSFYRRFYVYTNRPNNTWWETWRDENFQQEITEYGKYIDFWMEDGYVEGVQDMHCQVDLEDCRPSAIISFERMYDPLTGPDETIKLARAIGDHPDVNMIEEEAWPCIYNKTYFSPYAVPNGALRTNMHRTGPDAESRTFTAEQLARMQAELVRLRDKYSGSPWDTNPLAQDLVTYLDGYIMEVTDEIATM